MTSLSQVHQGHLHESGFVVEGRSRLKEFSVVGTAQAGTLDVFDSYVAPIQATYEQTDATVLVTTPVPHGLVSGVNIGITFGTAAGGTANPGNYDIVDVPTDTTFTLNQLNSKTIAAGTVCRFVFGQFEGNPARFVCKKETSAGDTFQNIFQVPNSGFIIRNAMYLYMENVETADVFYEY